MYKINIFQRREKDKRKSVFIIKLAPFLILSPFRQALFQQSYGFGPAAFVILFSNAVVFLFLLFIITLDRVGFICGLSVKTPLVENLLVILAEVFLLSCFSEHVTIFVLFVCGVECGSFTLVRYRKLPVIQVNFLWSSILGAYFSVFKMEVSTKAATGTGYIKVSYYGIMRELVYHVRSGISF